MAADLGRVQPLIDHVRVLQGEIEDLERALKERKRALRQLLDQDIPETMNELGLTEVKTSDGLLVQVVPFVDARIPRDRTEAALAWLREHGFGDLIKHEVAARFGAGDDEVAREAELYLEEIGVPVQVREAVHPQTLKAWAREQLAAGHELPEDLFGIYTGLTTKLKEGV